ncbi:hypothetical protein [Youxingia wuxianensis]|uniref:Uncharacterized protein n=1 Tax=Youxingia wuxianensis TaxID=2763678 RepID=A0A926IGU3_9FIRM|nr:hypothetical protein [Youxingia wuxianensis]MBC8584023.1 hypothetical protein [Youxingia wuxianensis]
MDLLDRLADLFGCQYLSDLKLVSLHVSSREIQELMNLDETSYSLEDYTEAASYILNEEKSFSTIKQAKQAIVQALMLK